MILGVWLVIGGCGERVQFIKEGEMGGVMVYVYKGTDGHLLTPQRTEAFNKIHEYCPQGYHIVREGQAPDRKRVIEGVINPEVLVEKRWGIRFRCRGNNVK